MAEVSRRVEKSEAGIREMVAGGATISEAREKPGYHTLQRKVRCSWRIQELCDVVLLMVCFLKLSPLAIYHITRRLFTQCKSNYQSTGYRHIDQNTVRIEVE